MGSKAVGQHLVGLRVICSIRARPQFLLGQEVVGAARDAQDAYPLHAGIVIKKRFELWSVWVRNSAGEYIHAMTKRGHGFGCLLHVDQLPAKVWMLSPVAISGVKVPLWVEKCDVQAVSFLADEEGAILSGMGSPAAAG